MLAIIVLLGFFLRIVNLNQSLWLDEAISALAVKSNSLLTIIPQFSLGDFHPPLYYLILKLWTDVFGYSEIVLRAPSVFFGTGTIVLVYLIGKKLRNERVGILAAAFMAVNPLAVYYSQETRMYTQAMFFTALAIYFYLVNNRWAFTLSLLGALYTDYLPWLLPPVLILAGRDRRWLIFSFVWVGSGLLIWLPVLFRQLGAGVSLAGSLPVWGRVVGGFEVKALPLSLVKFAIGRISTPNKFLYGVLVLPVITLYAFVALRVKEKLLWLWLFLPLILGTVISVRLPIFSYFRFLFVLPALILLLAIGVGKSKLLALILLSISLVTLSIFNLSPNFWREDWRALTGYLSQNPGLVVLPNKAQSAALQYYSPYLRLQDKNSFAPVGRPRVYLIRYVPELFDPQERLVAGLQAAGYLRTGQLNFTGIPVWIYENRY